MGVIARNFGALVAFFGMSAATVIGITVVTDPPQKDESTSVLIPCPTEDSDNCYRLNGGNDGEGKSFVTINDRTYYFVK